MHPKGGGTPYGICRGGPSGVPPYGRSPKSRAGADGVPMARPRGVGRAHTPGFHRCAKTIENISRIRMVVSRASGTLIASSLKQNTFLTLKLCPAAPPTDGCAANPVLCTFWPTRPNSTQTRFAARQNVARRTWFCVLLGPGNSDKLCPFPLGESKY